MKSSNSGQDLSKPLAVSVRYIRPARSSQSCPQHMQNIVLQDPEVNGGGSTAQHTCNPQVACIPPHPSGRSQRSAPVGRSSRCATPSVTEDGLGFPLILKSAAFPSLQKKIKLLFLKRIKAWKSKGPTNHAKTQNSPNLPSALSADLTSLPSRPRESPRHFNNSREIYRQPSSWGCWEPGRPPEPFPFSCPSSSLSSLLPLLRCQPAPGLKAERKHGSRSVSRSGPGRFAGVERRGRARANSRCLSRGRGPGRGSSWHPVDSRPAAVPPELLAHRGSREPATGASHRGPRGRRAEEGAGAAAAVATATWAGGLVWRASGPLWMVSKMIIENFEALKSWLSKTLEPMWVSGGYFLAGVEVGDRWPHGCLKCLPWRPKRWTQVPGLCVFSSSTTLVPRFRIRLGAWADLYLIAELVLKPMSLPLVFPLFVDRPQQPTHTTRICPGPPDQFLLVNPSIIRCPLDYFCFFKWGE